MPEVQEFVYLATPLPPRAQELENERDRPTAAADGERSRASALFYNLAIASPQDLEKETTKAIQNTFCYYIK